MSKPWLDDGDLALCACGFHCTECGSAQKLHVHHLRGWAEHPAGRLDPDNAVTLCRDCHVLQHSGGGEHHQ